MKPSRWEIKSLLSLSLLVKIILNEKNINCKIVAMAKEAVNKAHELPLSQGLSFEKKLFWSTFATVRIFFCETGKN